MEKTKRVCPYFSTLGSGKGMRTTSNIEDSLIKKVSRLTGILDGRKPPYTSSIVFNIIF